MEKKQILAVCTTPSILAVIQRLINNNPNWQCTGAATLKDVIQYFNQQPFDLVLLGSGLTEQEERALIAHVNQKTPLVKHYGGGSGLLNCEIMQALPV
ncbi:hypothetical protein [Mucilaginibacter phyllosphaerae]